MTKKTALSKIQAGGVLANVETQMFPHVDFKGLSAIIEKIGERSANLSVEEKVAATEFINAWEKQVLNVIFTKVNRMRSMSSFLTNRWDKMSNVNTEILESFAKLSDTVASYEAIKAHEEDMYLFSLDSPDPYNDDPEKTNVENLLASNERQKKNLIFNHEYKKMERKHSDMVTNWKKILVKTPIIQELLKKANQFIDGSNKLSKECEEKVIYARLNVNVSSVTMREALTELMDLSAKI